MTIFFFYEPVSGSRHIMHSKLTVLYVYMLWRVFCYINSNEILRFCCQTINYFSIVIFPFFLSLLFFFLIINLFYYGCCMISLNSSSIHILISMYVFLCLVAQHLCYYALFTTLFLFFLLMATTAKNYLSLRKKIVFYSSIFLLLYIHFLILSLVNE